MIETDIPQKEVETLECYDYVDLWRDTPPHVIKRLGVRGMHSEATNTRVNR